jgi:hypothetical protein
MTGDVKQAGPQDRSVINMTEDWEVQWWCQRWGVTAAQLKAAVAAVGAKTASVAAHLGKEP